MLSKIMILCSFIHAGMLGGGVRSARHCIVDDEDLF